MSEEGITAEELLREIYVQQAQLMGYLQMIFQKRMPETTVTLAEPAALIASLDQLNAGIKEMRRQAAEPLVVDMPAPQVNFEPFKEMLEELTSKIDELGDKVAKGGNIKVTGGGGSSKAILLDSTGNPYTTSNPVAIKDVTAEEEDDTKFDYGTRTDANPVRIGTINHGGLDTAEHLIKTFTYDSSARVTRIETTRGPWV